MGFEFRGVGGESESSLWLGNTGVRFRRSKGGGGGSATLRTLVGLLDGSRDAPRLLRDWQRALGVNAAPHPDALERALRLLAGQGLLAD